MAFSLNLKRVLVSDSVDNCCKTILEANGIAVDLKTKLTKEELLAEIPNYDGLIVRSATKVTAEVIKAGKNLKIIGRAGTGVDNIDIPAASLQGIIVMNTPGGNTISAAEQTCVLISTLARHTAQADASMKAGKWDRKKYMGSELLGKTLAIVGLGRIGREVAHRMQSYGVTTIGYDPIVPAEESAKYNIEWMELDQLWPKADYITVHTPLIPQTKGLLGDKTFPLCKKGVYVVNCARGGIIDEASLLRNLESGQCGGAGLDVFETEPPNGVSAQLAQHPKVIACPHLGASTVEAQTRVAKEIAEQFVDAVQGKSLFGVVNATFLADALKPQAQPWLSLGEKLGKVAACLSQGKVAKATVTTYGADMKPAGRYITAAVSSGIMGSEANLVNSSVMAKEKGCQVSSTHVDTVGLPYPAAVSITFNCDGKDTTLTGTVVGLDVPVLVKFDSLVFSGAVPLSGNLSFVKGSPGKVLADLVPKFGENGSINYVHVAGGGAESVVVVSTSSQISAGYPCIAL
ncbi:D-3-phosphoglycerate dehydrogenase-like [Pocillopora verrucosa]|uniref:D-3-phosphoglycerate dehydrogenase-like n=1 Tax=Pocillopora verrucosa TaxID=203993 RepID=UPI00333E1F2B